MALSIVFITQRRHFFWVSYPSFSCSPFFTITFNTYVYLKFTPKDTGLKDFIISKKVKFDYLLHALKLIITFKIRGDVYSVTYHNVFRIMCISKDPKMEVLRLKVDSKLGILIIKIERIPVQVTVELQRTALSILTGDNVTDFYVRNYLFEFGSGHWNSSLRLFLDILRPSRKTLS
jgi:hypothetical protein